MTIVGRLTAVYVLLRFVDICARQEPNGLGDPTPTAHGACCDFIESKLPLNRRGGVAPPSFNTKMVELTDMIMSAKLSFARLNGPLAMKFLQKLV